MYIHSTYKQIKDSQEVGIYRKQLKEISKINLRQSSKFNVLAVLGALKCLDGAIYDKNLSIYLASEYNCTQNMLKVIDQVNDKGDLVMPFDFLNINTNNAGFYISQALDTVGRSINITSQDLSFEKAFELAYFDLTYGEAIEALVGGADESLADIAGDYELTHNLENQKTKDGTSWLFLSPRKAGAIAKIKALEVYENIDDLNNKLKTISCDKISLNQYAKRYSDYLDIDLSLLIEQKDEFYGTAAAAQIVNLLAYDSYGKDLLHISLDEKKRAYLFLFERVSGLTE